MGKQSSIKNSKNQSNNNNSNKPNNKLIKNKSSKENVNEDNGNNVNLGQTQEEVHKKDIGGRFIRTSGYRHKKRRNKHLFISDEDSPSQIKYNYKYERVNSEKKREKQLEEMMEQNQSSNVEKNKKSSNKQKYQEKDYDYQPHQLYTFYKDYSEFDNKDVYDKETTDTNVHMNNNYPLNHLYEAFIYLGRSKSIRRANAWYDNDTKPLFMVDYDAKAKNQESQISVRKLSLSVASVYAHNYSPKAWHLIDYGKRNQKDVTIKASANFSKKIMDQVAEIKRTKKRTNSTVNENAFEACPIALIQYPEYNPFDAEDGAQEDYEPFYDYQAKLNRFINNLPEDDSDNEDIVNKKLNANDKSNTLNSSSSKMSSIPSLTSNSSSSNQILSGAQVWNNYIKSRQELKIKRNEIRSKAVSLLKEAVERRKRLVQRPSPQKSNKPSVAFNSNHFNKQNSSNKKHHYNNKKKDNKNSTYAKYVASYSIYNDINKLMQPNTSGYPINYKNVIERINNYYYNGGSYQINAPIQQQNNQFYNSPQNNRTSVPNNTSNTIKENNNNNNTTNNNYRNSKKQQKQPQSNNKPNKSMKVNVSSNTSFNKTKSSPLSSTSKSDYTPNSGYSSTSSPYSTKSPEKQNNIYSPYMMTGQNNSKQQYYFSNSYSYGTNHVGTSVQNKPRSFNSSFKQKSKNNNNSDTTIKNKESTKKHINVSS